MYSESPIIDATSDKIEIVRISPKRVSVKFLEETFINADGEEVQVSYGYTLRKNGNWIRIIGSSELINYEGCVFETPFKQLIKNCLRRVYPFKKNPVEHIWAQRGIVSGKVRMPYSSFVFKAHGKFIQIVGWHLNEDLNVGDHLILPNGEETTRYKILKIEFTYDGTGMFFLECEFAPRES